MIFTEIDKSSCRELPFILNTLCNGTKQNNIDRPEGFTYHQILWVTEGSGYYSIGNETHLLSVGDGIFMRAGVPHSYGGKKFHTAWCSFTLSDSVLDKMGIGSFLKFTVPATLNMETEQLIRFANGNSNIFSRSAAGYSYVIDLFTTILSEDETLSDRVKHLLEQRYAEPLTLTDLSEYIGADRFMMCRAYKREKGITIMDDLKQIRIKKAKQLLKYNVASVEETGRLCGFESSSYFVKRFRETVGCTPAEYRKRHTQV